MMFIKDKEIYLNWFLSLEDNSATSHQLKRCLRALMLFADEMGVRLRHLSETGEDLSPEERGVKGMLRRFLSDDLSEESEVQLRRLF
jgi:hypothetical protein